ncbi:hypothetical protein CDAR_378091 [Caerostris darwini]|uniref:Secreted protein n=1 Tax=Caerostris darwini TaxID=1538125 RepID=A0AAV4PJQ9_9ARAC|nr:hypothetical protein CDAR_378091 [Caerostris darwini]
MASVAVAWSASYLNASVKAVAIAVVQMLVSHLTVFAETVVNVAAAQLAKTKFLVFVEQDVSVATKEFVNFPFLIYANEYANCLCY